jgi:hypothetical protein
MNLNDKDIDKMFQNASDKQEFVFEDGYWNEMQALLPAKKNKKKLFVLWGLSLIAITAGAFIYSNTADSTRNISENKIDTNSTNNIKNKLEENASAHHTTTDFAAETSNTAELETKTATGSNNKSASSVNAGVNNNKSTKNKQSKDQFESSIKPDYISKNARFIAENTAVITGSIALPAENINPINFANNSSNDIAASASVGLLNLFPLRILSFKNSLSLAQKIAIRSKSIVRHSFYSVIGLGIGQTLVQGNSKLNGVFNLGLGYSYDHLSWGFKVGTTVNVLQTNGIQFSSEVLGKTTLKMVKTDDVKQLVGLQIPIVIYGKVKKQFVFAGCAPGVNSAMWSQEKRFEGDALIASKRGYFKTENFQKFSFDLKVGYAYQFSEKTQVGIDLTTRASQTFKSNSTIKSKDFPILTSIFLQFDF